MHDEQLNSNFFQFVFKSLFKLERKMGKQMLLTVSLQNLHSRTIQMVQKNKARNILIITPTIVDFLYLQFAGEVEEVRDKERNLAYRIHK